MWRFNVFVNSVDTNSISFVTTCATFSICAWANKKWTPSLIFDTWHCWQSCRRSPWLNFGNKLCTFSFFFWKGTETKPCRVSTPSIPRTQGGLGVRWGGGWWRSEKDGFNLLRDESLITATSSSSPSSPSSSKTHKHKERTSHRAAVTTSDSLLTLAATETFSLHSSFYFSCVRIHKMTEPRRRSYINVHFLNASKTAL